MEKPFETYFGGKGSQGTYQAIINHIRPHQRFVEVFAGNATISRKMKRADENILIDLNPTVCERLVECMEGYKVVNQSGIEFLKNELINPSLLKTAYFIDPPYLMETRKSANQYEFELIPAEHEELLQVAVKLDNPNNDLLICTYPHDLYKDYLKGWFLYEYQSTTRGGLATEWLFMNYHESDITDLHDYTHLGGGHRERQLYRKKMKRWLENFGELPQLFQNQLLAELLKEHQIRREVMK
ncbi:hypothetical protein [Emticicia sp. BO119]|uniref:hypothetical protein n=1 Tax=Emticicia sp. BO119 TaxID=2757768 RepID=UPI0015F0F805|nr:hypothetical protein [Emticicia sp. BO119]MBA4849473.1 hypothetical protein [Emticicia sp. BO119]